MFCISRTTDVLSTRNAGLVKTFDSKCHVLTVFSAKQVERFERDPANSLGKKTYRSHASLIQCHTHAFAFLPTRVYDRQRGGRVLCLRFLQAQMDSFRVFTRWKKTYKRAHRAPPTGGGSRNYPRRGRLSTD